MPNNPQIPLSVNSVDSATPVRQVQQDQDTNAMNSQKLLQEHYKTLDDREVTRLKNVVSGAAHLKPFLDAQDTQGATNFLLQRKAELVQRQQAGENIDTAETDAALQMAQTGDWKQLDQNVQGLMAAGRVYGILDNEGLPSDVRSALYYQNSDQAYKDAFGITKANPLVIDQGNKHTIIKRGQTPNDGTSLETFVSPDQTPELKGQQTREVKKETHLAELREKEPKARASMAAAQARLTRTIRGLRKASDKISGFSAGTPLAQLLQNVWGTDATDLAAVLDTVRANIGFDELDRMRQNSPGGASGLGQVTERELAFLQNVLTNLEVSQTGDQLKENLAEAIEDIEGSWIRIQDAYHDQYREVRNSGGSSAAPSNQQPQATRMVNPSTGESWDLVDPADIQEAMKEGFVKQ